MNKFLTIFTPTYNRKHTLVNLYKSLEKQTNFDFEWIIIDDGSKDGTEELVNSWIKLDNQFDMYYYKCNNGGKHRAINKALDIANGKMFFIVDSDDYLTEDAVEKIIKYESTLPKEGKFAGIAFSKGFEDRTLVGKTFKGEFVDATSIERKKYNILGDKAEIFYTTVLKENKFPEFEGEKFITEAVVWNRIAKQGYKIRWFQDIIYICEYRDDGLTKSGYKKFKESPKGLLLYIKESIEYLNLNLLERLLRYSYYSKAVYENRNIKKASEDLGIKETTLKLAILLRKIGEMLKKK